MAVDTPMVQAELTPVLPIEIPPTLSAPLPSLPPIAITSKTSEHWIVSRHVFAAAYPRSRLHSYIGASASSSDAPGARLSSAEVRDRVAALQEDQYGAPLQGVKDDGHLWLAVNCYKSKSTRTGSSSGGARTKAATTMILAHATGLHKETWEPALNRMAVALAKEDTHVDEVWSLDLVNQGDSAILNAAHLGPAFDWMDVARDIANFVLQYIPEYSQEVHAGRYATQLPRLSVPSPDMLHLRGSAEDAKYTGPPWRGRNIVMVGHSIGGASSVSACSFLPPNLVRGLLLVDATVQPLDIGGVDRVMPLVHGALVRRDIWSSKSEALTGFQKNKAFFGRWHPEALASYVENALYVTDDGKVTLKTRRKDEAATFLDPNLRGARACWNRLRYLPRTLRVHIMLADPQDSVIQTRGISPERILNEMYITAPTYQQLYGTHHMIVQEDPQTAAETMANCISAWIPRHNAKL